MRRPLLLAVLLVCGCRPTGEEPRSAGTDAKLEAPAPSSVTLAGLLSTADTGYDNVQQALYLREESKRLGISALDAPSGQADEGEEDPGTPASYDEVVAHTRDMTRRIAAQRRAIEKGRPKPVGLEGTTPGLIPGKPQGGPIETAPEDGSKALEVQ